MKYEKPRILVHAKRESEGDWSLLRGFVSKLPSVEKLERIWQEGKKKK